MKTLAKGIAAIIVMALMASPAIGQDRSQGILNAAGTSCPTAGACVTVMPTVNRTGAAIQVTGTFAGTILFEATADGGTWAAVVGVPQGGGTAASSTTTTGTWQFSLAGLAGIQARMSAYSSGAATTTVTASGGAVPVSGVVTSTLCTTGTCSENVSIIYGALATPYAGTGVTVTTLALSSGTTVMTADTVDVQGIRCNNFSGATVYVTLTDTAGNLFHGEATAQLGFAIPAYSDDQVIAAGSHVRMVGIKMYAGTASAVNCLIWGKQ